MKSKSYPYLPGSVEKLSSRYWSVQFSSVARLCPTLGDPWTAACQDSLSITNSWSLLKLIFFQYMTTGKTIALTRWTFVGKVMSLLFNMLSRLVIAFLPRRKRLLISWLQSPSEVIFSSVQFSSVAQLCPTLCDPMNRSTPGLLVLHQLPEFTQTHVHRVGDAIQPSHPLLSTYPAPNPSQHQGLFQ